MSRTTVAEDVIIPQTPARQIGRDAQADRIVRPVDEQTNVAQTSGRLGGDSSITRLLRDRASPESRSEIPASVAEFDGATPCGL